MAFLGIAFLFQTIFPYFNIANISGQPRGKESTTSHHTQAKYSIIKDTYPDAIVFIVIIIIIFIFIILIIIIIIIIINT